MEWLINNAFLILVLVVCVGMHLFGHGHKGHGGHRHDDAHDRDEWRACTC